MDRHDTLLLACEDPETRKYLRSILGESYHLLEARNGSQMLALLEQNIPCIAAVLVDISPKGMLDKALSDHAQESLMKRVPVIALTDVDSPEVLDRSFALGATDVIPLHYEPYAMLCRIQNIVELHLHKQNLEELVRLQTGKIHHANEAMIDALSSIIEYRSAESGQHILRIRHFTRVLLEEVARSCPEYGLTEDTIAIISGASVLHDVGKIAIADAILCKPGPLTPQEQQTMQTHTTLGCRILESLSDVAEAEYLRYAHNICHYHHERWDGGGYPEGISGEDIPICAQVVGLADVYDALTTKRVYKDAVGVNVAANMIINGECGVFSPKLLECFKGVLGEFEELVQAYADGLSPRTEDFSLPQPELTAREDPDSMEAVYGKFQCLLHYVNALVLELSVDREYFHLRYNPYPELALITGAGNFRQLEELILNRVVVPEDRQAMEDLIHKGIPEFLQAGLRRQSFSFRFRAKSGTAADYEVTLLRANVNQKKQRSMAVLCRRQDNKPQPESFAEFSAAEDCACRLRNDRNLTLVDASCGFSELTGYAPEDLSEGLMALIHPEDREPVRKAIEDQLSRGNTIFLEYRAIRSGGDQIWLRQSSHLEMGTGTECLHTTLLDVSDFRRDQDRLQKKLERYEIILAQTENVLFDWDVTTDRISFSDTCEKVFGFVPREEHGKDILAGGMYFHPDDSPLLEDRVRALEAGSSYEMLEVRLISREGRYCWYRFRASAIRDKNGCLQRIVGLILNIDAEKQAAQALQERADRDALTKLLNKAAGRRQAEEYLNRAPQGVNCALLIIDLDNFKQVNDSYGHLFGDTVLTRAAREIRRMFRNQDIIARIGGDEFMVLLRGLSDRNLVAVRCERLLNTIRNAFSDAQYALPISCSIGIALAPEHGSNYVDLFRCADQALYCAKDRGRNTYAFYQGADQLLPGRELRRTAVSNHIDSDDQPEVADRGLVQYAFQRLYASKNVDASIAELLALVGKQTNVSRVYVFENSPDNRSCSNTYEWCNSGIWPEIDNLQNVSYITDIPGYEQLFDENGIFYCPDVRILPRKVYDILAPQGIKSMLQCAIRDNGVFRGYIGFDECISQRLWTREQIDLLTYFSETLSVFLLKMRSQEKISRRADDLYSILDNQNAWVYIVDPKNMELKYLNRKVRSFAPEAEAGMVCYRALWGRELPCPDCPVRKAMEEDAGSTFFWQSDSGRRLLAETARIHWDGQNAFLITGREIPEI